MNKLEKEFNVYLADQAVMTAKLHNIHWNVQGLQFVPVHEFTEAEYEKSFERMDEVAEHLRMYGIVPASTLAEYLQLATIKEEPSRTFEYAEGLAIVLADLELLRKEATELRNAADKEGWFSAVSFLEDHVADYNKQIWFLRSMLAK
ncbi:DNA starvation/stationary phase protection protein [Lachnospiraceae bacterium oral taxon 500]|nr:DNA starvation/stationary phase protection protein [Lachnospiraceae bacterium oral taxon 500]